MRQVNNNLDPSLMDLDSENKYIATTSRAPKRVKLQRGEAWLVRFLPAALGPKRLWYVRSGRHWHNQAPITCPVHTAPDFGGDPDAYCPVCETAAQLNDDENKEISTMGYKATGQANWLTYCIVLQKSTGSTTINVTEAESLVVHEFNHYKATFEELSQFFRNSVRPNNPKGVLDYVNGCDFWVSKTGKGLRLDKQDPQPIFDDLQDPATDPRIKKLEEQMRTPKIVIPSEAEMKRFAEKLYDDAYQTGRGRGVRGGGGDDRSRRATDYEEAEGDHEERRPVRGGRRPAPTEDSGDDQIPGAEVPPRRPAPAASRTAPARTAPAPAPEPEPEPEPEAEGQEAPAEVDAEGGVQDAPPPPPPRPAPRTAAPAQRPAPAVASRPTPPARPAPAPARAVPPPPSKGRTERIDEGEELPEEQRDPAPPAEDPLPEAETQAPPPVARPAAAAAPSGLRNRIQTVTQRKP
jgi:hypothetical protein